MLQPRFPVIGVRLGIETFCSARRTGIFLRIPGQGSRLNRGCRRFARTHVGMFSPGGIAVVYHIHRSGLVLVVPSRLMVLALNGCADLPGRHLGRKTAVRWPVVA